MNKKHTLSALWNKLCFALPSSFAFAMAGKKKAGAEREGGLDGLGDYVFGFVVICGRGIRFVLGVLLLCVF
jgi:hypothetical protein